MPWKRLVEEIRNGNQESERELYSSLSDCARAHLHQSVDPGAVDDHVQEILMVVLNAIRGEELRDPRCLMGFVRTVARRQVSAYIRGAIVYRSKIVPMDATSPACPPGESPEARCVYNERVAALRLVLAKLSVRDRDILTRYYFDDQSPEDICREMHLTATQFRLFKTRALTRCCELSNHTRPRMRVQSTKLLRMA